jgi:acetyl esterase/lipase
MMNHLLKMLPALGMMALMLAAHPSFSQTHPSPPASPKVYSIMPLGDSITEGSSAFVSYRFALWQKLTAAGYYVNYVGSRKSNTRIGAMAHEGYSGKSAEYLAAHIEQLYRQNPADIVLLHAGHNHTAEEHPVPKIIAATQAIVRTIHGINPRAIIFVAQVIPSGKLPKYAYLPELNRQLAALASPASPNGTGQVVIVDQAMGFEVETDTVADKVHPNAAGAQKIAAHWFTALQKVLPSPGPLLQPQLFTYKQGKNYELKLHVFQPGGHASSHKPRAAVVYFFGGGWTNGTPLQFYAECRQLAAAGMVAISADYRIASVNHTSPLECITDAKSAIRWVRWHAGELGVDPNRIAAAGASAGGHLAAAAAMTRGLEEQGEDQSISSAPNALVLLYPVIDNGPGGYPHGALKETYQQFSPLYAIDHQAPPTIIFLGMKDALIPVATMEAFQKKLRGFGGRCDLYLYPNGAHPLYSYHLPPNDTARDIAAKVNAFFRSIGYLDGAAIGRGE